MRRLLPIMVMLALLTSAPGCHVTRCAWGALTPPPAAEAPRVELYAGCGFRDGEPTVVAKLDDGRLAQLRPDAEAAETDYPLPPATRRCVVTDVDPWWLAVGSPVRRVAADGRPASKTTALTAEEARTAVVFGPARGSVVPVYTPFAGERTEVDGYFLRGRTAELAELPLPEAEPLSGLGLRAVGAVLVTPVTLAIDTALFPIYVLALSVGWFPASFAG